MRSAQYDFTCDDYTVGLIRVLPRESGLKITARKINELMVGLGFPRDTHRNEEGVRQGIRVLRRIGVPVLSDPRGFWVSHDPEAIEAFVGRLESRASMILETADYMRKILQNAQVYSDR